MKFPALCDIMKGQKFPELCVLAHTLWKWCKQKKYKMGFCHLDGVRWQDRGTNYCKKKKKVGNVGKVNFVEHETIELLDFN